MITIRHLNRSATIAAAGLMLAGLAVPAAAENAPRQDSDQQTAAQRDNRANADQRQICVRTSLSGSRLVRRICKTPAEWEDAGGLPTGDQ